MDERVYWVWLQMALGPGSGKIRRILEGHISIPQFYDSGSQEWRLTGIFTKKEQEALARFTLEDARRQIADHEAAGQLVLTPDDARYPEKLRNIYDFPAALYVRGDLPAMDEKLSIAMVGTRKATRAGRETAFQLSHDLAQQDVVVVSGGAMGIDTAAHQGVLSAGGSTVCVLGCGIGYNYLPENEHMRRAILERGAVISEYPKGTPPFKQNFPLRNRIIAGLCDGVVVVEGGAHSGSLITARQAQEQNRDVFAVPGPVNTERSQGSNLLLKQGAKLVTEAGDILEEYKTRYALSGVPSGPVSPVKQDVIPEGLSENEAAIYRLLEQEPAHYTEISAKTGIAVPDVRAAMTMLELQGLARSYSGGRYGKA